MRITTRHFLNWTVILAAGFSMHHTSLAQESYRADLTFVYSDYQEDDLDGISYGVQGEIYFAPVETADHPYAEAAFLERAGAVEIGAVQYGIDAGSTIDLNGTRYYLGMTYIFPDSGLLLGGAYLYGEADYAEPLDGQEKVGVYGVEFGSYASESTLIAFEYSHWEIDTEVPVLSLDDVLEFDDYSIALKSVNKRFGGSAISTSARLTLSQFDDGVDDGSNTIIEIDEDYYFNRRFSLGAGLSINSGDDKDNEGKAFRLQLTAFANPTAGVNVEFEKFLARNDEGEDADSILFQFTGRF